MKRSLIVNLGWKNSNVFADAEHISWISHCKPAIIVTQSVAYVQRTLILVCVHSKSLRVCLGKFCMSAA